MIKHILNCLIGERDPLDLTTSEARILVAEFYERVELQTFGWRNRSAIDFMCEKALNERGLGAFA